MFATSQATLRARRARAQAASICERKAESSAVFNEISIAEHRFIEADGPTTRQRVIAAHREDERIVTEVRDHQPGQVDWTVDEGDVELAVDNCPRQIAGRTPAQTESNSRVGLPEGRKKGGQVHYAKCLNCPHVQLAA